LTVFYIVTVLGINLGIAIGSTNIKNGKGVGFHLSKGCKKKDLSKSLNSPMIRKDRLGLN